MGVKPFLKWAGGKRKLTSIIAAQTPRRIVQYWEPFVGAGAVYFNVIAPRRAATYAGIPSVLSDVNRELITTYTAVRDNVDEVTHYVGEHMSKHDDEDYYYEVRENEPYRPAEIAARMIYLNKTCYNGLYRVNKSGRFNVPRGRQVSPAVVDAEGLREASEALQRVIIHESDFAGITPGWRHFVYVDPPYSETFDAYTQKGFDEDEQIRLADYVAAWHNAGANVLVSSPNTELIRHLYANYEWVEVSAKRSIAPKGHMRDSVTDLLIKAYHNGGK